MTDDFTPYGKDMFGDQVTKGIGLAHSKLRELYGGVNPFTVLEVKNPEWQARKKAWLNFGLDGSDRRVKKPLYTIKPNTYRGGHTAVTDGTMFDPVLVEMMIKWFCPKYGMVFDPFAGVCTGGVVSRLVERRYIGCDINPEQVLAAEALGSSLLGDDKLLYKPPLGISHVVAAFSNVCNEMYAIARGCRRYGVRCTLFIPR